MKKSKYIDHTNLSPIAKQDDILKLCNEAIKYDFCSVCVNPVNVVYAKSLLKDTDVLVCTVIGFPLGANTIEVKEYETLNAILNGCDEIDMVINIAKALEYDYDYIYNEISRVKKACPDNVLKVILETSYLSNIQIQELCKIAISAKATFVKTSTGFSSMGATTQNVELMKSIVLENGFVKASGGIKDKETFEKMIEAGASRIGCSQGVNIMEGLVDENSTY